VVFISLFIYATLAALVTGLLFVPATGADFARFTDFVLDFGFVFGFAVTRFIVVTAASNAAFRARLAVAVAIFPVRLAVVAATAIVAFRARLAVAVAIFPVRLAVVVATTIRTFPIRFLIGAVPTHVVPTPRTTRFLIGLLCVHATLAALVASAAALVAALVAATAVFSTRFPISTAANFASALFAARAASAAAFLALFNASFLAASALTAWATFLARVSAAAFFFLSALAVALATALSTSLRMVRLFRFEAPRVVVIYSTPIKKLILPPRNHFVDLTHAPNETQDCRGVFESLLRGVHLFDFCTVLCSLRLS
jgi:hypothetical protein